MLRIVSGGRETIRRERKELTYRICLHVRFKEQISATLWVAMNPQEYGAPEKASFGSGVELRNGLWNLKTYIL